MAVYQAQPYEGNGMADIWGEIKPLINKGIDAWVDIETGGQTRTGEQPVQTVKNDGRVYPAGQASAPAAGVSPWVWVGAAGLLGLVWLMASR